jgi:DNA (cytosine-5)-methyltransferase 1
VKPRLLDLFCGAGGAGRGYELAGFTVMGVDNIRQPYHHGEYILADIRKLPDAGGAKFLRDNFDAVHASPPCQAHTKLKNMTKRNYVDLIPYTREMLQESGLPYVIENVPGAPLVNPILLCGTMFNLKVKRHRIFESNVYMVPQPDACWIGGVRDGMYHSFLHDGGPLSNQRAYRDAMGCDWMSVEASRQAIPPAYTKWIGEKLLRALLRPSNDR